jgi:lipopolysaccharide/colanic/teichoic acid biosynthesis glycosyltransferase
MCALMLGAVVKRMMDLVISGVALVLLSPVWVALALLITLDSRGGVLFAQERIGLNGQTFRMYKFRSMVKNAERSGTGLFSFENDPRITRVGKWLRRTSLDELPQLLNVLRGDMSIVGPRPPVSYELGDYRDFSGPLKRRFEVKPGITGLAQVSGRNDLDWSEKISYDNQYIDNYRTRGISYDIQLIIRTVSVVLSGRGVVEKAKGKK